MALLDEVLYRRYVMDIHKLHTETILRCQCCLRARRRRKPGGSGRMSAITVTLVHQTHRRSSSPTLRTGREKIRNNIFAKIVALLQADVYGVYDRLFSAERESGALIECCILSARP